MRAAMQILMITTLNVMLSVCSSENGVESQISVPGNAPAF